VVLTAPRLPELAPLLDRPMEPGLLLYRLRASGVNLIPRAADGPRARKKVKEEGAELRAHEEIATIAPLCEVRVIELANSYKTSDICIY